MSNTSFCFGTRFCCLSHHRVNNKCNRVKGRRWICLIYALYNFLCNNMLRVFRSNHHCSWRFHKFHRKTLVLESLFKICRPADLFQVCLSLYPIIHINYVKSYCLYKHFYGFSEIDLWKRRKKPPFISQQTSIYMGHRHF